MDIGKRIKIVRREKRLSATKLGQLAGISQSTISKLENGKRKADIEIIEKIADALNISIERLTSEPASSMIDDKFMENFDASRYFVAPILGSIRGGPPTFANDEIEGYIYVDSAIGICRGDRIYYLRVTGDSMTPKYQPGDLVLIRQQPVVENGEVAAVLIDRGEACLKKVYINNGDIWLHSTNPSYELIKISNNRVIILGKAMYRLG